MGEKPLLRGRQGVQQKRQGDRGGELRAGGQRVRSISKQRVPAVTRKHERGAVATLYTGVAGTVRAAEVDGVTLAATVTATVAPAVGVRIHRQRYHVRQFRPIILRPCEMPSLYLRAMGRTLWRMREKVAPTLRVPRIKDFEHAKHDDRYLCLGRTRRFRNFLLMR